MFIATHYDKNNRSTGKELAFRNRQSLISGLLSGKAGRWSLGDRYLEIFQNGEKICSWVVLQDHMQATCQ